MKKLLFIVFAIFCSYGVFAQTSTKPKNKTKLDNAVDKASDFLVVQMTYDSWTNKPDSIKSHKKGLSRGLGIYVMFDKKFRGNPSFSLAYGIGITSSSTYYDNINIGLNSATTKLPFTDYSNTYHFKKYKLATTYAEIPLELRYSSNPDDQKNSFKVGLGVKIGTLLNAHTKGKTLLTATGVGYNSYTEKITSKKFFNSTRIAATARVGYGNFSLFGSYQLTNIFKDGVAKDMKLVQIGLQLSGL